MTTQFDAALITSSPTDVGTLPSSLLAPSGSTRATEGIIRVVSGTLTYAYSHNPQTDPDTALTDTDACFSAASGTVFTVEGYDNLRNFKFLGTAEFYISVGA